MEESERKKNRAFILLWTLFIATIVVISTSSLSALTNRERAINRQIEKRLFSQYFLEGLAREGYKNTQETELREMGSFQTDLKRMGLKPKGVYPENLRIHSEFRAADGLKIQRLEAVWNERGRERSFSYELPVLPCAQKPQMGKED